jgi:Na+/H+ antiporter NhaA
MWLMLHEAGLNATLAGVAMGLLAPSTPRIAAEFVDIEGRRRGCLTDHPQPRRWAETARLNEERLGAPE